ncbi:MAG: T9SS type A sorting domain-containing protein [bacterium]
MNILILLSLLSNLFEQTDWMGGKGLEGPVNTWGTRYYTDNDSITVASEGQISLIATGWNYTNWTKHTVEANPGIEPHAQGLLPADINNDGKKDLMAHTNNQVVWYENTGNWDVWTKHIVGNASSAVSHTPCTWPADINKDKQIDIVVASDIGLGWFQNLGNGASWSSFKPANDTTSYHRCFTTDWDLDGDIDIIGARNNSGILTGRICFYFNNGSNNFSYNFGIGFGTALEAWRVYPADFNNDGYPDISSVYNYTYVFLNDPVTHKISGSSYYFQQGTSQPDFDGAWAVDINMDGYKDLVTAAYFESMGGPTNGFWAHINDGTGLNFTRQLLVTDPPGEYTDGAMARDIDMDGKPDIAGTLSKVGWFRQTGNLTFTLYPIDVLPTDSISHWIYVEDIDNKCTPDMELLVTRWGAHLVYENNMLNGFAPRGELVSSILQLNAQTRRLQWFGWEACIPGDSTLAFYWRTDTTVSALQAKPWTTKYYPAKEIDSVPFSGMLPCYKYFQYKVEFRPNASPLDVPVLYRVWLRDTVCTPSAAEEKPLSGESVSLKVSGDRILLNITCDIKDAKLSIYNTAGNLVKTIYKGALSANKYTFVSEIRAKGVYLVVLKTPLGNKTVKLIKLK